MANIFGGLAKLKQARLEELENILDIGPKVAQSIYNWFRSKKNLEFLDKLETVGIKAKATVSSFKKQKLRFVIPMFSIGTA